MARVDWFVIIIFLTFSAIIGAYFTKRAGKSTGDFFLSGRKLPWWIAGTSMVATTFAADTPLAVTELVAQNGIAGNWLWWNMAFGGMLAVFFFSRLWRRAGIMTDVELIELRYSGKPAAILRGFKAIYFGLFLNSIIIGWVSLAMETILRVLFPELTFFGIKVIQIGSWALTPSFTWTALLLLIVAAYSLLGGLWSVAITDLVQFIVAMTGCIVLAIIAISIPQIGGMSGLKAQLPPSMLQFTPDISFSAASTGKTLALSLTAFFAYIGVQWWSSWYPGSEPGGGGYVAQRMMSAKDEKNSFLATLWFTIAHYCIRPWPWIIAALVSVVLYPGLANPREGFVMLIRDYLPPGLKGLMVAAFFAAFMSTIATQLNWGTSYLVNDLYKRFIAKNKTDKHYVVSSRVLTFLLSIFAIIVTSQLNSIKGAWELIIGASAGLGLVLILRWYWWRINAWSELVATIFPLLLAILSACGIPILKQPFPQSIFVITGLSTIAWIAATFISKPEPTELLEKFFSRVHPGGPGWNKISSKMNNVKGDTGLKLAFGGWLSGVMLVYSSLFAIGYLIMQEWFYFGLSFSVALITAIVMSRMIKRIFA